MNSSHRFFSAVVWQPPVVSLGSYPIEGIASSNQQGDELTPSLALSAVDCFHPSLQSHELLATSVWNRLVGTAEEKAVPVTWTTSPMIRCLEEDDRILTNTLVQ